MVKIAITINLFAPNTKIESAKVNTNFTNSKTAIENASYRAFSWAVKGTLTVANEQGMKWIVPQGLTALKLWAKSDSGSGTIRIQVDTTDIKSSFSFSNSVLSTTSFDSTTIAAGTVLTFDVLTVSSADSIFVLLESRVTDNF